MRRAIEACRRWLVRLPAYGINGIGVALGVLLVQLLAGVLGGTAAALLASGGAIYASLADTPNPPERIWRRVALAASVGLLTSVLVTAVRGDTVLLGVLIGFLAFGASMMLAWGMRAGPISFVPVLAIVFTMAAPAPANALVQLTHAAWTAAGGAVYLAWAWLASRWMQPRYGALALGAAVSATAALLRSRARLLSAGPLEAPRAPPLQDWMARQVRLDEALQTARDLLFATAEAPDAQRRIAVLLDAIALRDTLLGSELDLDLLGGDMAAERLRLALAAQIDATAGTLERLAQAVQWDRPLAAPPADGSALEAALAAFGRDPQRASLAAALGERARHIADDLAHMLAIWQGQHTGLPLAAKDLRLFVSPEGWPLAGLRTHLRLASPVMRHAIRSGCALAIAYFLALAQPWASHPHWLVLSVAVVLRGSLDQTLARRDARVSGTVLGCLVVLLFAWLDKPYLSGAVFLLAVGAAHAFVNVRYLVTAVAATVMALLQAHIAHPAGGFAVGERLADTLLGAVLAWGFCYVLPAWEQRGLARLVTRVREGARVLATEALRWPEPAPAAPTGQAGPPSGPPDLALRLARREFYEAIGSIAASAQRSQAEPMRVQLPLPAMATLLTRCHVLLAQLSAVRTMLERGHARLDAQQASAVLARAAADIGAVLGTAQPAAPGTPLPSDALRPPPPNAPLQPWLERRLGLATQAAQAVAEAADAVMRRG